MDNYPISSNSLEKYYHINGNYFGQQYKEHLSDFQTWEQKSHAKDWIFFPDNIGTRSSIDETALTSGELYTIVTNKAAKGKKGVLVAMIEGTDSETVINVLDKISEKKREVVEEVTLDMAGSTRKIITCCFPKANRVIDRFHVQKTAYDALQEIRIAHRWDAINQETNAIENAKADGKKYVPEILSNGDTTKQLLARSQYLLFKSGDKWTDKQKKRATILFELYPDLKQAYSLTHALKMIFSKNTDKGVTYTKMAKWFNDLTGSGFKSFNTISATFYSRYPEILNFFDNRGTNASAESFNAKLKASRATLRGVVGIEFFLFRVAKIYA